ncbi:Putative metal-dependent phosphoesterase TrpH [Pseudomonas sp. OF001]|uniref:TrlF family AAA-like ATPase n=1 Tax=Pseudomonas sp. OF001 TaxID=2772300 RepID=UPI00191B36CB|nr:AAA family ATPase [Pseudomonas sp. OF001]CAD5378329.1 Putative metal-dependent phosphoesterase TrpH [Pseudomonas sp. OF001]
MITGSKWFKFDLHTHTPYSFDYGRNDPNAKNITPEQWLRAFADNKIDCVAITDHNSGAAIDPYKAAANQLHSEGIEITVFPGVEISACGGVHILAIFDPSQTSSHITSLLGAIGYLGTHGDSDAVSRFSPEQVISVIHQFGGIAIPAHIDMPAGYCVNLSGTTLRQSLTGVDAVEIIDRTSASLQAYRSYNLSIAELRGSDSHNLSEVGRAFTWLKMSIPNLSGLRLALIDGPIAVIRSDDAPTSPPNTTPDLAIISLSVSKSKYCGMAKPFELQFSPWLNSVIGGRGSGKSSLVEFIRLAMGRSHELTPHKELHPAFLKLARVPTNTDPEGLLKDNTQLELIYRKDTAIYKITWGVAGHKIFKKENDSWIEEAGSIPERFPIRIFSQKQIFELSKNANILIQIIDESSSVRHSDWSASHQKEISNFNVLRAQQRAHEIEIETKPKLEGELADLRSKLSKYAAVLQNPAIENFKVLDGQKSLANGFILGSKATTEAIIESLGEFIEFPSPLNKSNYTEAEIELDSALQTLSCHIKATLDHAKKSISDLQEHISNHETWIEKSSFGLLHLAALSDYQAAMDSLNETGIATPGHIQFIQSEIARIEEALERIELLRTQNDKITQEINQLYLKIIEMRVDLSRRRQDFLNKHLRGSDHINIEIHPFAAKSESEISFRSAIGKVDKVYAGDIYDQESAKGFIPAIVNSVKSKSTLQEKADLIHEFKAELLGKHTISGSSIGKRFSDYLRQLDPSCDDRVWCWFPDDEISISFKDKGSFKDISMGSAGQRTATILSLLLSHGTEPLILDQPEDDLDNQLISSLIVERLKNSKPSRQMIVITHNPNIVVNGDSELVIGLEEVRGQTYANARGGLQEQKVREHVCEVMEGGKIALENRYKRIALT